MTQETLKQANTLNEEIKGLKAQKRVIEVTSDTEFSKVNGLYSSISQETCLKIKNIILDNLQEQINRKTKQLEAL